MDLTPSLWRHVRIVPGDNGTYSIRTFFTHIAIDAGYRKAAGIAETENLTADKALDIGLCLENWTRAAEDKASVEKVAVLIAAGEKEKPVKKPKAKKKK